MTPGSSQQLWREYLIDRIRHQLLSSYPSAVSYAIDDSHRLVVWNNDPDRDAVYAIYQLVRIGSIRGNDAYCPPDRQIVFLQELIS